MDKSGLDIARSGLASSELGLSKMEGMTTWMGLNKMGLSKKRKEGRGKYHSSSRGGMRTVI